MESLAKDDMCDVETDSEIIAIKTGISNRDTQPEIPCDEVGRGQGGDAARLHLGQAGCGCKRFW